MNKDQKKKITEKKFEKNYSSFAQKYLKKLAYYLCGKVRRKPTKCLDEDKIAKKDWMITKMSAQTHIQNNDWKKVSFWVTQKELDGMGHNSAMSETRRRTLTTLKKKKHSIIKWVKIEYFDQPQFGQEHNTSR